MSRGGGGRDPGESEHLIDGETMILLTGEDAPRLKAGPIVSLGHLSDNQRPSEQLIRRNLESDVWSDRDALLRCAQALVLVTVLKGGMRSSGTGFYISHNLIVSAAHLLKEPGEESIGPGPWTVNIKRQDGSSAPARVQTHKYRVRGGGGGGGGGNIADERVDFMILWCDLRSESFLQPDFTPVNVRRLLVAVMARRKNADKFDEKHYNLTDGQRLIPGFIQILRGLHRTLFSQGDCYLSAGLLLGPISSDNREFCNYQHNASTLGGFSGSPVLDLHREETLHFRFIHLGYDYSRDCNLMMSVCNPDFQQAYQTFCSGLKTSDPDNHCSPNIKM